MARKQPPVEMVELYRIDVKKSISLKPGASSSGKLTVGAIHAFADALQQHGIGELAQVHAYPDEMWVEVSGE